MACFHVLSSGTLQADGGHDRLAHSCGTNMVARAASDEAVVVTVLLDTQD